MTILSVNRVEWTYVNGFWKTNRIVTLGLFHFIGPANGYTCTLHKHSTITRLAWLVCFSRASFADPVNSWLKHWDPWGGTTWKAWVWNSLQWWGDVCYAIEACLGIWLALLGLIANLNTPNRGFNPPPPSHPPPPTCPPPITCHQWYYSGFEKKLLKIQQCKLAGRNSYKMLAKRLFQLYIMSGVATI